MKLFLLSSLLLFAGIATSVSSTVIRYTTDLDASAFGLANAFRRGHNVTALEWNATMAEYALARALMYTIGRTNERSRYSEIISLSEGSNLFDPRLHVRDWYMKGMARYNFTHPVANKATKKFTQLLWKNTKQIGCAWISGGRPWKHQLRCEFWPPGNIGHPELYLENVLPELPKKRKQRKFKTPSRHENDTMDVDDLMTSYHVAAFGTAVMLDRMERRWNQQLQRLPG
ncbi:hypothetical protein ABW21_db0201770 [Orbilia brochopaga]|nr:hypothetical protein ABW21_db0201770 [Drechslerella brochopaga]